MRTCRTSAAAAMLLADKLELQNVLKRDLIRIEEKELNYFNSNCRIVALQAAVIGAFSFTALTEQKGFHGDGEEVPWPTGRACGCEAYALAAPPGIPGGATPCINCGARGGGASAAR